MKPKIFIGSSVKGKEIAEALQMLLSFDAWPSVWHQAFPLSKSTIDTLLQSCIEKDFAVFVFSNDDTIKMKDKEYIVARDNVIFESGLFMGMNGKDRCFIVSPRDIPNFHLPSDFSGFTVADYDPQFAEKDLNSALGPAVHLIKQAIKKSGWERFGLYIYPKIVEHPGKNHPLKLYFNFKNITLYPIVVDNFIFEVGADLKVDETFGETIGLNKYKPTLYLDSINGQELWLPQCIIEPGKEILTYISLNEGLGKAAISKAMTDKTAGKISFRCTSLGEQVSVRHYEQSISPATI
jgi:hypothetical protein